MSRRIELLILLCLMQCFNVHGQYYLTSLEQTVLSRKPVQLDPKKIKQQLVQQTEDQLTLHLQLGNETLLLELNHIQFINIEKNQQHLHTFHIKSANGNPATGTVVLYQNEIYMSLLQPQLSYYLRPDFMNSSLPAKPISENVIDAMRTLPVTPYPPYKKYRLAFYMTADFWQQFNHHNLEKAFGYMVSLLFTIDFTLRRDVGIQLELVTSIDDIEQMNSLNTQPSTLAEFQTFLDEFLGAENYDAGHLITDQLATSAYTASVCHPLLKARAHSRLKPNGWYFHQLNKIAHEIGHQFGATHTFNATGDQAGFCQYDHSASVYYDLPIAKHVTPGSGVSLMGYAGYCNAFNLQDFSEPYYHPANGIEMRQFVSGNAKIKDNLYQTCGSNDDLQTVTEIKSTEKYIPTNTDFIISPEMKTQNELTFWRFAQMDNNDSLADPNALFVESIAHNNVKPYGHYAIKKPSIYSKNQLLTPITTATTMHFSITASNTKEQIHEKQILHFIEDNQGFNFYNLPSLIKENSTFSLSWFKANTDQPPFNCNEVTLWFKSAKEKHYNLLGTYLNDGQLHIQLTDTISSELQFKLACSQQGFFTESSLIMVFPQLNIYQTQLNESLHQLSLSRELAAHELSFSYEINFLDKNNQTEQTISSGEVLFKKNQHEADIVVDATVINADTYKITVLSDGQEIDHFRLQSTEPNNDKAGYITFELILFYWFVVTLRLRRHMK